MTFLDWSKLRAKLHHDWLQKSYRNFLEANLNFLNDPGLCLCQDELDDIIDQLLDWNTKQEKFQELIDGAEGALSPRQLMNEHPLVKMSQDDKQWLGDLVHCLYLERTNMVQIIDDICKTLGEVENLVSIAASHLRQKSGIASQNGDALLQKIIILSMQMSSLPHDINVVWTVR